MGLALMPPPAAVDILVLPHHGTPAPGLRAWLEAVHPRLAIASTSRSLPRRTVRILDAAGIPSLHTGRDGAVHLAPAAAGWRPRETDRRRR
ncbi:MAG: hypothetical protein ACE5GW_09400 [Planctomycetota bacterium]